jgi:hypothetical protein
MNDERRYGSQEIREILELADRDDHPRVRSLPEGEGLTASELEDVGREAGFSPERVARAIVEYEARGHAVTRGGSLVDPPRVSRTVSLARAPSDREWEMLVSELRTTFDVKGEVTSRGGVREWSHASLHAFVEPTEAGYRLRMTDSMAASIGSTAIGAFLIGFALLIFVILLGKEEPGMRFAVPAFFSIIGGGLIAGTRLALPRWTREREDQMQYVAGRARSLLGGPASNDEEASSTDD